MTGRHHAAATRLPSRRTRLILAGTVLAGLVLVGVTATVWPVGGTPEPTGTAIPDWSAPPAAPERDPARPGRGGPTRADAPAESPAPASPADPAPPSQPELGQPDGGGVVVTGSCEASYYWEPQPTASGEVFDPEALTAAHQTWDFGTRVRVTNPGTGQSVVVRINDRGPYIDGRCLDLARGAFREIAALDQGVVTVTYEVLSD